MPLYYLLFKQYPPHAQVRLHFIEIPCMERVSGAELVISALRAFSCFAVIRPVYLKAVLPDFLEIVASYISLNKLGPSLDIQAGRYIPVVHYARRIYAGVAKEIPAPDFSLVVDPEEMAAAVADLHLIPETVLRYEIEKLSVFFLRKLKLGIVPGPAYRLDVDDPP